MTLATGRRASPRPQGVSGRASEAARACVAWFLSRVLPHANPDFEGVYDNVNTWWVEIDSAGVPQRELGFDALGATIVAGPIGENMGFWTDSHMEFEASDYKAVPMIEFESAWSAFEASHPALAGKGQ